MTNNTLTRTFMDGLDNLIDRAIGIFSPIREGRRRLARVGLRKIRTEQYEAAKTNRLTGNWRPVNSSINDIIGASWATVTARVRQLVRDFPYFARAVDILVDYSVGQGILFQSRIRGSDDKLNKPLNQQIENAFNFWADEADVTGRLHFYELMQLTKRQDVEAGEFLLVKVERNEKNRFLPYALQIYEPDWLTDYGIEPLNTNKVNRGIEYDPKTGVIKAYHFTDPDSWGKAIRVTADRVIHGFKTLRPGQMRGITPFAPGVLVAGDLHNIMDAELDAAKMASKYLAFIYKDDPFGAQGNMETDTGGKKIDEMENAIIEYLRSGEKVEIASNPRPGSNFSPFVKLVITMLAVTTGVPYELLSGDYTGMNYSQGRTKRNDFSHELRPVSIRHIRHFCLPAFLPFMEAAVMNGKLNLPYYFSNPYQYLRTEWQPPGMESVDPLRETKARIDEIKALLRSPQEIVKARGRDLEDVYKEIAEAKNMAEELGLDFGEVDTSLANNPAAIGADENDEGDNDERAEIIRLIKKQ